MMAYSGLSICQSSEYEVISLGAEQGLPEGYYDNVCFSDDGLMWAYSQHGIFNFNGIHAKVYNEVPHVHHDITHLYIDTKGRIWANNGKDIYRYHRSLDSFIIEELPHKPNTFMRMNIIKQIDDNFYVYQERNLWLLKPGESKFSLYMSGLPIKDRAYNLLDSTNVLWLFSCDKNITRVDLKSKTYSAVSHKFECIHSLTKVQKRIFYAPSWGTGIVKMEYKNDTYHFSPLYRDVNNTFMHNTYYKVFTIPFLSGDSIYYAKSTASNYDIDAINVNTHTFLKENELIKILEPYDKSIFIRSIYIDNHRKHIWICDNKYIHIIRPKKTKLEYIDLHKPKIYKSHYDGFISNINKGPFYKAMIENDWDNIIIYDSTLHEKLIPLEHLGLKDRYSFNINRWAVDHDGYKWLSAPKGIYKINRDFTKVIEYYKVSNSNKKDDIYEIKCDEQNTIWIATKFGIFYIKNNSLVQFNSDRILDLEYRNNMLTYSSVDFIVHIDCKRKLARRYDTQNREAYFGHFDGKSKIWYYTRKAIKYIDVNTGIISSEICEDFIRITNIRDIYVDTIGYLWLACDHKGIYRYAIKDGRMDLIPETEERANWKKIQWIGDNLFFYGDYGNYFKIDLASSTDGELHNKPYVHSIHINKLESRFKQKEMEIT
jgi:hypothetical protein